MANQFINVGIVINTLCGQTAPIRPQDIQVCFGWLKLFIKNLIFLFNLYFFVLQKGVNDFSILIGAKSKKDLIFLGPAVFIKHSCLANTKWVAKGEYIACAQAIKPIEKGQEITADYGDSFFGNQNIKMWIWML